MGDNNLASHFEDILDKEDGAPEKPTRQARAERAEPEGVAQEELFPQREIEDEPADEDDEVPPRPEQVDDEDEEEDDLPEEQEEEEARKADLDLDQVVRVNVDGEPAEISLKEALNGYVRSETFHRRLNQLGTVAQQLERERVELSERRDYYASVIPLFLEQLNSLQLQEPDWDKAYAEDPVAAAKSEREWRSFREKVALVGQERQRVEAERMREQQRREAIYEDTERRKLAHWVPEWTNGKKWERDRRSMVRTALAAGYSEQELEGLKDARATMLLLKAAKYDELMASKPKPVRQQGALRPGAISSRAAPNGLARAERRLQRSGSVRDAAKAFEMDLDREG